MNLRNGKTYEIKCKCQKWYPNSQFNNQCSECYRENDYEGWKKHMRDNWCPASFIEREKLDEFINNNKIQFMGCQWKMLLNSVNDIGQMIALLNYIKFHNKTGLGITAKEGAELYARFRKVHGDKYGTRGAGEGSDWKWQHLFAGLIFDTWNITTDENGSVAYCYYGNFGAKPRGATVDLQTSSSWIAYSYKDLQQRGFWVRSLPDEFGNLIF